MECKLQGVRIKGRLTLRWADVIAEDLSKLGNKDRGTEFKIN